MAGALVLLMNRMNNGVGIQSVLSTLSKPMAQMRTMLCQIKWTYSSSSTCMLTLLARLKRECCRGLLVHIVMARCRNHEINHSPEKHWEASGNVQSFQLSGRAGKQQWSKMEETAGRNVPQRPTFSFHTFEYISEPVRFHWGGASSHFLKIAVHSFEDIQKKKKSIKRGQTHHINGSWSRFQWLIIAIGHFDLPISRCLSW